MSEYRVDWERRRLLPINERHHNGFDPAAVYCWHGERLVDVCPDCQHDIGTINP